jgi:hypothetical protein
MKTIRIGDRVTAEVTSTDGHLVTATMTVNRTVDLGCGCVRLVCDRPGTSPRRNGVHLFTGCRIHDRTVAT